MKEYYKSNGRYAWRDISYINLGTPVTSSVKELIMVNSKNSRQEPTYTVLKEGSTGENVIILQDKLKITGHFAGSVTGSFGKETTEAVEAFQLSNQLPMTGVVDERTWELLLFQTMPLTPRVDPVASRPVLRLYDEGPYVKLLQEQLTQLMFYDGPIDGVFGVNTQLAVKTFQTNNKLTADGVVGRNTWNALIYLYSPLAICGEEPIKPPTEGQVVYIVQPGDTLYSIARKFGTTVDRIKELNNLTSDVIYVNQELIIEEGALPEVEYITYTVQKGDTLYSIARRFNTTVAELKSLNNLTSDVLSIGQQLIIKTTSLEPMVYIVQKGDTLYSIARRFNTTVAELKSLNNLTSDILSINQKLLIPR